MKKSIIAIISILLIVSSIGSVFCNDPYMPWSDPAKTTFWAGDRQVSSDEFMQIITQEALKGAKGTVQYSDLVNGTASSGSGAKSTSKNSTQAAPKNKITVTFTDENGNHIGSVQVTEGTTIADSQFIKDVPDCNGKKFDSWDYDGSVMMYDWVVRAIYK